jgi:hypothetical protein
MALDMWNIVKTQGIDTKICAGNIQENLSDYLTDTSKSISDRYYNYFSNMNHAWILAEVEPLKYVAVETTRGYLV